MSPFALPTVALSLLQQDGQGGGIFFPPQATEAAAEHDRLFMLILGICAFFFVLINVGAVYFAIRYRRREEGEPVEKSPSHNTKIELVWTIIPTIIVCFLFYYGLTGYINRSNPPAGAYTVYVTGSKWSWNFTYPEGFENTELHAPVDKPVRLVIGSTDVLHSVFIPQFRIKMDAVPGRYTEAWFDARIPGDYNLFCAEYCGQQHSLMSATVRIHPDRASFDAWVKEQTDLSDLSPAEWGAVLYRNKGCIGCHSLDGLKLVGPTFQELYMSERSFTDGTTAIADEEFLRESILQPQARIAADAGANRMTEFATGPAKLEEAEVIALIEFIKSQSTVGAAEIEAAQAEAGEEAGDGESSGEEQE